MGLPYPAATVAGIAAWHRAADRAEIMPRTTHRLRRRGGRSRGRHGLRTRPRGGRNKEAASKKTGAHRGCDENSRPLPREILDILGHHTERAVAHPLGELRDLVSSALGVLPDHCRAVLVERACRAAKHLAKGGDFARGAIALLLEKRRSALAHRANQLGAHLLGVFDRPAPVGLAAQHGLGGAGRGADRGAGIGSAPLRERAGSKLFGISHRASSACPNRQKINQKSLLERTVCALSRFPP